MRRRLSAIALGLALLCAALPLPCAADADSPVRPVVLAAGEESARLRQEGEPEAQAQAQWEAEHFLSFSALPEAVRRNNLNYLIIEQAVESLEDIDYEQAQDDIKDALGGIAEQQFMLLQIPFDLGRMASASLQQQYDALHDQFVDLREGETQRENADRVRELRNTQNQLILTGQSIYIQLCALQAQRAGLVRQGEALGRQLEELELRHELGQISDLTLQQARVGETSLRSGLESLDSGIRSLSLQLSLWSGGALDGELTLGGLPRVSEQALEELSLEADLDSARAASWELYSAEKTFNDAKEEYDDYCSDHGTSETSENYRRARRTWQAAQYTYQNTVVNYELRFRTLYEQLMNYRQVLQAQQTALEAQRTAYAAQELKHEQGNISDSALLSARDELTAAEEAVSSAENDLFSAYNNYCWARDYGIMN